MMGRPLSSADPRDDVRGRSDADAVGARAEVVRGRVIGRYLLLEQLHAEARAEVFAAYDEDLERQVTLHVLRGDAALDAQRRRSVLRDAQAIARVRHPNVLTVFDVGTVDGRLYLATDRIGGTTLGAWLRERGRGRVDRLLEVLVPAARGLAALHAADVVLGRFDAEHVLLDVEDDRVVRVRVSPFEPSATSRAEHDAATREADASVADARDDQLDFCAVAFEALWGHPPFGAARTRGDATIDDRGGHQVPPRLRRAILRGLEGDPAARHPDMAALVDAIVRARRRRWPSVVGVAGVAAVLALAVGSARRDAVVEDGCGGGVALVSQRWNDERRGALLRDAGRLPVTQVQDARTRVARRLDAYAAAWTGLYERTCREQDAGGELARARAACVEDLRLHFGAIVDALTAPAAAAVDADALANDLPPLNGCDRVESTVWISVAHDDATAPELLQVLAEVREIGIARVGGGDPAALEQRTVALMRRAEQLGNPYVSASVRLEVAIGALLRGDIERALADADRAFDDAVRSGADMVAVSAVAMLLRVLIVAPSAEVDGARWLVVARALLARSGPHDALEADIALHASRLAAARGDAETALAEQRAASEATLRAFGPETPQAGSLWAAEAGLLIRLGRYEEALPRIDAAIERLEAAYGRDHLGVLEALEIRAFVLDGLGDADGALALLAEIVRRVESLTGRETFVSSAAYNVAQVAAVHGHVAMAAQYLATSRARWPVPGEAVGEAQFEYVDAMLSLAAGAPELCIGFAEDALRRLPTGAVASSVRRTTAIFRAECQLVAGRWRAAAAGLDAERLVSGVEGDEAAWGALGVAAASACGDVVGVASSLAIAESSRITAADMRKFVEAARLLAVDDRSPSRRAEAARLRDAVVRSAFPGDPVARVLDQWIAGSWPPADRSGCAPQ